MALAADQAFDMDFSGGAPSATAPSGPSAQGGAADQPFDMNFSGGARGGSASPSAAAPRAAPTSSARDYYASLTSDYAQRSKAEDATRAAIVPKAGVPLGQGAADYWRDLWAPGAAALKNLGEDVSAPIGTHNAYKTTADLGALVASPVTGFLNAEVVQPGASLLDQFPASQRLSLGANGKVQATTLTPAEQHAQNEQIISTALMGLGPEGKTAGNMAEFVKAKNASNLASVVTKVPAEVALDASGRLSDEGLEYAAKANVDPKELEAAYKAVQYAKDVAPKPPAPAALGAEPAAPEPPAQAAPAANDAAPAAPVEQPARASAPPAPQPEPAAPPSAGPSAIWRNASEDHPVEITGEPQTGPDGRSFTPVRSQVHGGEGYVPTDDLAPAPASTVRVGPNGLTEFGERPEDVPTTPEGRAAEAHSIGVKLSEGQATRDSSLLDSEERLRANLNSPRSAAANQFKAEQANSIADAVDAMKQSISDPTLTAEDRGNLLQSALRQAYANGKAGVSAVYDQLRQLTDALGDRGSNILKLDTGDLTKAIKDVLIDENVDPQARAALKQQAAQYGLIGGEPKVYEDGSAVVKLLDQEGKEGPPIQLPRAPEPLTIQNAEKFRQGINSIYREHEAQRVLDVKGALSSAVDDALSRAVNSDEARDIVQTAEKARAMHRGFKDTFDANNIVSDLIAWKKEGVTPKVDPDKAIGKLLQGGKNAVTSLKRVKEILLAKPQTEQSLEAWQHIKGQAIEQIFDQARVINANGGRGAISGTKLQTAIKNFGIDKLKVLLDEKEFNQLMKIKRVSVDASVMPDYIVNNSNSANIFQRYFAKHGRSLRAEAASEIPIVGGALKAADEMRMLMAEDLAERKTLNGILNFKPPKS